MEELNRLRPEEFAKTEKIPVVVVLDNVRSMYNVGAVFRTCDAFRVKKLVLCGITACPPHREIHKTALGAENTVSWEYFSETRLALMQIRQEVDLIVGVEQTDNAIVISGFDVDIQSSYAIIFGNEASGLSDDILGMLDICIEIPQFGTKHSLNISVAAGIVLYHFGMRFIEA